MKITTKRLKEIIAEEMQRLDESYGRHMAGETERMATASGDKDEEMFRAMVEELIGRRGMPARSLHRIIDEVEGGYTSTGSGERDDSKFQMGAEKYGGSDYYTPFQESKRKTKKRNK